MSRAAQVLAVLALGCGGGTPPAPEEAPAADLMAEAQPAAPEAAEKTETFQTPASATAGHLRAADIAALQPLPPTRAGKTPAPLPADPRYERTIKRLTAVLEAHAGDPQTPWAVGHGMIALGPEFTLSNGKNATTYLFEIYAEEFMVDGHIFVRFPRSKGDIRVEFYKDFMLKVFVEIGVVPELAVTVSGQPHTLADLYRGALIQSSVDPVKNTSSYASPNDMPWSLQALAMWAPPSADGKGLRWVAADGTPMSLHEFTLFNTSVLVQESQFLFEAMQAGADIQKRGQGIFRFTCGGAHLLQGVAYSAGRGHRTELSNKALQAQIALMFWRLPKELKVYDELMKKLDNPQHMVMLLIQRLKFTGHFLETMHKLAILGLYQPTAEQQALLKGAADQVVLTVEALDNQKVLDNLPALRQTSEQMFLDVIGDSAHAVRGLRLALGTDTLAW
jgi:hypothetical protein